MLFVTLSDFDSIDEKNIYTDLLREFVKNNCKVYIVSPVEKRKRRKSELINCIGYKILKLRIGNMQKTNLLEKGLAMLALEHRFKRGIKKYFHDVKFDLIIYSTPPITLQKVVKYIKKRDKAKAYLLLKDIFPQNAVDLGILHKTGLRSGIYNYFRKKEIELYKISDHIGCTSIANVNYIRDNNSYISADIVEVCPNSIEPQIIKKDKVFIRGLRKKYNIPLDKVLYIYGGNLGKPQGIEFLINCLKECNNYEKSYFLIVGSGTEYYRIERFFEEYKPGNAKLLHMLHRQDYENLVSACDVGLIYLDKRFTVPNTPSRLLSYMNASLPILACTDVNTDIGDIVEKGKFGLWCESTSTKVFKKKVSQLFHSEVRKEMGDNAMLYLEENYTSKHSYDVIMNHFDDGSEMG